MPDTVPTLAAHTPDDGAAAVPLDITLSPTFSESKTLAAGAVALA